MASYGNYYQWGRDDDGHERRTSATTTTQATDIYNAGTSLFISNIAADWASVDTDGSDRANAWADGGTNDICPVGFSVPTSKEIGYEIKYMRYDPNSNIPSYIYRGVSDMFASFLKMPAAGYRDSYINTVLNYRSRGTGAYWWTMKKRTLSGNAYASAYNFEYFSNKNSNYSLSSGMSVRCIKN